MTSVLRIRTAGAVLTAGLCILQTGWYPAAQAGSPRQAQAPVVVEKVRKVRIRPEATLIGTVFPFRRSAVAGEAEGLVVEFPVRRGQRVEKGQVLARIQEQPYRLRLKAARAGLAEARENEAEARSELRRISALFEKKSVSSRTGPALWPLRQRSRPSPMTCPAARSRRLSTDSWWKSISR
ncbi:MAG: biotin/lipoyl-binding protein [Deltaproteobacteria bacterium]|nr:biotin/lipoyl-binding protein [Deltaproteobacteria bacterium]